MVLHVDLHTSSQKLDEISSHCKTRAPCINCPAFFAELVPQVYRPEAGKTMLSRTKEIGRQETLVGDNST